MISSHTGFQPLREVWLGDCYPACWYDHFDSHTREVFHQITELTKKDLNRFEKKLQELGVLTHRPRFDHRDRYCDWQGNLCKPPITPRDWAMVLGDTLYVVPQYPNMFTGFDNTIQLYQDLGHSVKVLDRGKPDPMCFLPFPSTVRVGKDLFVDFSINHAGADFIRQVCDVLSQDYRVHITHSGDHHDGVFCPIAPGQIFSTHYRTAYDQTFPDWHVFWLSDTTKDRRRYARNGRWWVDGIDLQIHNDAVLKYASDWIGNFLETVFEVNMLVIDDKNICCIMEDDAGFRRLEQLGITPHVVDFKTRGFWDGGLHCLTVDIHRLGERLDYWPNRGSAGIYTHAV
jgi:hypothetical protein